ncbi:apoptosis facilitator Bcl-2-like protein 14 [Indicator indicator]|uniref:apoptosis facilitator Bcl-2-like protein 14 n=1 Tax=Indicator indicator TaxID=1002788 RepID=UPI0023DF5CA7|nr:apoptosis facilitator Bcl-2-like protein 14 [Indicator indicator]
MPLANDVTMEDTLLEDDERDSIEYKILMAYARRRLPASTYRKLLESEANVQKSASSTGTGVTSDPQWDEDEPIARMYPGEQHLVLYGLAVAQIPERDCEPAYISHIADNLAKLVTVAPRPWEFRCQYEAPRQKQDKGESTAGKQEIILSIVSLLKQRGDQLEEKMKKDGAFYQCFKDMLSYSFFKGITDWFLKDFSEDSPRVTGGQAQRLKIAYTMEVATRLKAIDNHPMNRVLGFGSKYLREHFKPWIQDQGGWEKAVTSQDEEEVE